MECRNGELERKNLSMGFQHFPGRTLYPHVVSREAVAHCGYSCFDSLVPNEERASQKGAVACSGGRFTV